MRWKYHDSSFDSGGEMARDLFNEWSYYYANLWEHKEAQLAGEVAGNNQVDMDRYDSSATSPAVTSRMLFPLINGGEYTFTNGQRTKRMLVIEDDPVTINGTSYQEFRFVEDLAKNIVDIFHTPNTALPGKRFVIISMITGILPNITVL